jgi:predicted dehydrogenase
MDWSKFMQRPPVQILRGFTWVSIACTIGRDGTARLYRKEDHMTNIGIIGCGNISRFHYEGYAAAGATIAHACDARLAAAEAVAARYGARASADWRAVLDDPRVQLVSICLPASLHKPVSLAAIAAGKGVVCEKTLTDHAADSADIARAAQQAGAFYATAYMKRYFPAAQRARELLAGMGPITSLYARTWQPFAELWDAQVPDVYTRHPSPVVRNYGGGVLVCGGSHILDLIHWLGGRPTQVCGQMRSREGLDFDIQANAMLWLPEGGLVHFEAQWHPLRFAGYERNGWDERLEINTPSGRLDFYTVKWDFPEKNGALLVHQDAATGQTTEYRYPAVNPFHIEMADLLARFESGQPAAVSAWDGYVVDELIETITASAARGGAALPMRWKDAD